MDFYKILIHKLWIFLEYSQAAPVKTDKQILENSMIEDDPNANFELSTEKISLENKKVRWGPSHKGAQELANLYSPGNVIFLCVLIFCFDKRQ